MANEFGAGKFDSKIKFFAQQKVQGSLGPKVEYAEISSAWANVKFMSDGERWYAGSLKQSVSVRFIIRERVIGRDWQIQYKGVTYNINGVKEIDGHLLEITCGGVN